MIPRVSYVVPPRLLVAMAAPFVLKPVLLELYHLRSSAI